MSKVYLNTGQLKYCSFGVRNYINRLQPFISNYQNKNNFIINLWRGFFVYNKNSVLWSPGQGGSLLSRSQIVTVHDVIDFSYYGKNTLRKNIKYFIHNYIYRRCKCLVFISDYSKLEFESVFNIENVKKVTIKSPIYMASNVGSIKPLEGNFNFLQKKIYFLLITNGMEHKNNKTFLNAIIKANEINPNVIGVIVGELSCIDSEVVSRNQLALVNFKNVSGDVLFSLIEFSAAVCSCSKVEGHNLTAAEAISQKKICILSDIPVHREFYDGYAMFFKHDSVGQLFELINLVTKKLIAIPEKINYISNQRSWSDVAEEYNNLFDSI